jgi:hypothetical protein
VRRIQKAKEEQSKQAVDSKGKSRADDEQQAPHEEKQRLLEREGSLMGSQNAVTSIESSLSEVRIDPRDDSPEAPAGPPEEAVSTQPLMTPGVDTPTTMSFPISEKAKGKMKARRSQSFDTDNGLDLVAAASSVGRNGFIPTQEWITSWQQGYFHICCFNGHNTYMIIDCLSTLQ